MTIYFFSERTCAVTVNGLYLGIVDNFERRAEAELSDRLFFAFLPADCNFLPVRFLLSEEITECAPEGVCVYRLTDGLGIAVNGFLRADLGPRVLGQLRLSFGLATLLKQGGVQLTLQTPTDFFLLPLSDDLAKSELLAYGELLLVKAEHCLAVISATGELVFQGETRSVQTDKTLTIVTPLFDGLGRTATYEFDQTGKRLGYAVQSVFPQDTALLLFGFLESLRLGADYTPYLADELLPQAGELKAFLGNYVAVLPRKNGAGLVYPAGERIFDVKDWEADLTDGKISNLREL